MSPQQSSEPKPGYPAIFHVAAWMLTVTLAAAWYVTGYAYVQYRDFKAKVESHINERQGPPEFPNLPWPGKGPEPSKEPSPAKVLEPSKHLEP
jgi:hypothetical protein